MATGGVAFSRRDYVLERHRHDPADPYWCLRVCEEVRPRDGGESEALWLVPRNAVHQVTEWADEFDLKYRRVDGYSIKARLKEARERAGTAGPG